MHPQLAQWAAYMNFGPYQQAVMQQCNSVLYYTRPQMQVVCSRYQLPGEPLANYLIFKDKAQNGVPLQIILSAQYPMKAPFIMFDVKLERHQLQGINYLDPQTGYIRTQYHAQWNQQTQLSQVVQAAFQLVEQQPPQGFSSATG